MACCNPLKLYRNEIPPYTRLHSSYWLSNTTASIPCGYCLNCRVDRRNQWSDRAKWEYVRRRTASFVTVTYDDYHLYDKMKYSPVTNQLNATLDYYDIRKFIWRLRSYIRSHPEIQNVLCQPDFSYIYVGEYGENGQQFDRPHFHILFFGLDFAYCKKMIEKCWKNGIVDVLPLLDGGINYVLKYMDKELHGLLAKQKYDDHLLARPKMHASLSFGSTLYTDKYQEIIENDMTYKVGRIRRPVPQYYRNKLKDAYKPSWFSSQSRLKNEMATYNLHNVDSVKAQVAFSRQKAVLRERKLRQQLLNNGIGVIDYTQKDWLSFYSPDYNKVKTLSIDKQRSLVRSYLDSLEVG